MDENRILVVYYSRTGNTRQLAEAIRAGLGADGEEIIDTKSRRGPMGSVLAGKDAMLKRPTSIEEPQKDPAAYDLVVVGTPVWAGTMCSAVRTYLARQKDRLPKVAFFLTTMRSGTERTFAGMAELTGTTPVATLGVLAKDMKAGRHADAVESFVKRLEGEVQEQPAGA